MLLSWRGKEYTYKHRVHTAKKDGSRNGNIEWNIYGADTESVSMPDRYEILCFQLSSARRGESLVYLPERANALERFTTHFIDVSYDDEYENRGAFIYFHNLMYDWLQLSKRYPELVQIARTGRGLPEPLPLWSYCGERVLLKEGGLFTGTAPHFSLLIERENRRPFEIAFRDTWSFFPSSLAAITDSLGLTKKEERPENLGKIDYRKLSDSDPEKQKFEHYSKIDALGTRETAEKIRQLHQSAEMQKIRVSAPGYAIAKLYHVIPPGTQLESGTSSQEAMQIIVNAYAGGRTGGIYHGRVKDISVLDIHSSYPASMTMLPSFTTDMRYIHLNCEQMPIESILELLETHHCFVKISGIETDAKYPALIQSVKGKLFPVFGEFAELCTTGVELWVGLQSGTLTVTKYHEIVVLDDESELHPFRDFILGAYSRKENAPGKEHIDYISAKLEMNSSYGKLIESHGDSMIALEYADIVVPYIPGEEKEFAEAYYSLYIKCLQEETDFAAEVESYLETIFANLDESIDTNIFQYADLDTLSLTKKEYGYFVIPAAAALITGISRARLITAIKGTNALYWDTDSIFVLDYDRDKVQAQLLEASKMLPPFIQKVCIGDALGELDVEIQHASGYLAGTKRYYLQNEIHKNCKVKEQKNACDNCPDKKKCGLKKALHGIPSTPYDEAEAMIEALALGNDYTYTGKPRPLKAKESRRIEDIGKFVEVDYTSCFSLDDRLQWTQTGEGWAGNCIPFAEL